MNRVLPYLGRFAIELFGARDLTAVAPCPSPDPLAAR